MGKLPYASAEAGAAREPAIRLMLREAGASAVGFMQDDDADTIICQFRLAGREITVPVSVHAYAKAWMAANPRSSRMDVIEHNRRARAQAEIAVWAILADWIKAQVAMLAAGFLDVDTAFLPHIHGKDGRRIVEALSTDLHRLLPAPDKGGT